MRLSVQGFVTNQSVLESHGTRGLESALELSIVPLRCVETYRTIQRTKRTSLPCVVVGGAGAASRARRRRAQRRRRARALDAARRVRARRVALGARRRARRRSSARAASGRASTPLEFGCVCTEWCVPHIGLGKVRNQRVVHSLSSAVRIIGRCFTEHTIVGGPFYFYLFETGSLRRWSRARAESRAPSTRDSPESVTMIRRR